MDELRQLVLMASPDSPPRPLRHSEYFAIRFPYSWGNGRYLEWEHVKKFTLWHDSIYLGRQLFHDSWDITFVSHAKYQDLPRFTEIFDMALGKMCF